MWVLEILLVTAVLGLVVAKILETANTVVTSDSGEEIPVTALEVINYELKRLHDELGTFTDSGGAYGDVLKEIGKVNDALIRLAEKEEDNAV